MARRSGPMAGHRTLLVIVALGLAGLGAASCSASTSAGTDPVPGSDSDLTPAGGTYEVGRTDVTLVDESRDAAGEPTDDAGAQHRTLPTIVLYPTEKASQDPAASPPMADGKFPLVVFSHGVTADGETYAPVLEPLAAAGYVVALPTFPLTSGPDGWKHLSQVPAQAHDVGFIVDTLLDGSSDAAPILDGHLSPDAVAAAGHSLGAITSLMLYNSCCRDDRIRAVVAVSGMGFEPAGKPVGVYDDPPDTPLLLMHGTADKTVPHLGSEKMFAKLGGVPRALVLFDGLGHTDIAVAPLLEPTFLGFLDMELRGDRTEWDEAVDEVRSSDATTIEIADGLPD